MKNFSIVLLLLLGCLSFQMEAQDTAIKKYEQNAIYLSQDFFSGLKYVQDGVPKPFGFFGQKLKQELAVSPMAVVDFKKYQNKRGIGLGLVLAGTGLMLASIDYNTGENLNEGIFWGGFAAVLVGGGISASGFNNLNRSIYWYNRDVLK